MVQKLNEDLYSGQSENQMEGEAEYDQYQQQHQEHYQEPPLDPDQAQQPNYNVTKVPYQQQNMININTIPEAGYSQETEGNGLLADTPEKSKLSFCEDAPDSIPDCKSISEL